MSIGGIHTLLYIKMVEEPSIIVVTLAVDLSALLPLFLDAYSLELKVRYLL